MKQLPILLLLSCQFSFYGCVSVETIRPELLLEDASNDILVSTYDGRKILMESGDYQIVDVLDSKGVRGKGKVFLNKQQSEFRSFEGILMFGEILTVEQRQYSLFHYTVPILCGLGAVIAVLFIIISSGPGPAG